MIASAVSRLIEGLLGPLMISTMPVCKTSLQVLYPAEAGGSCDAWASMMQWFILQNLRHFSASSFVLTVIGARRLNPRTLTIILNVQSMGQNLNGATGTLGQVACARWFTNV